MNDKKFYIIIAILSILGIISTFSLVHYTLVLHENLSLTSFISNDED